jgi:TRAP-type C4-dicarboxylate transport system permease small subunit
MNKWIELILGLIILGATIILAWASSAYSWTLFGKDINFLHAGWIFFKGAIFWFLIFVALILIILGIIDLKE